MRYGNMEQRCRSLSVVKDDSLVLYVLGLTIQCYGTVYSPY